MQRLFQRPAGLRAPAQAQRLFSVDGGPLTENVVLSSDQRVLALKRTAGSSVDGGPLTVDLRGFLRSSITSPDAPPGITSWDVLPSLTSRRSRPRLLPKAALRPGTVLASLASDLEVVFISELTKKNYIWRNASMNVPISQLSKMLKSK